LFREDDGSEREELVQLRDSRVPLRASHLGAGRARDGYYLVAMLLDREGEKQELDRLLATVRGGESRALVVRGEAGIGKTALLDYAVASALDMQVASAAGVESEMELGFAGLHQLLVPFLGSLERLPAPQREALGSAFGLVAGVTPDLFLVGLAVLTLLADAAGQRPVLCVFDDAQWIDQASAGALGFVARRLLADRVGILLGVREEADHPMTFEGLSELRVGGLPDAEARELLATVAVGRLDERVAERIVAETQGNPLALVELGGELTAEEIAGSSRLPEPLPMGRRLEERFLGRVRALPDDARRLLLLAAAEPSGEPALVWRAAERLGIQTEAADLPEIQRLLTFEPRVVFRHPLIRSAVYQGASPLERRQAHEALAAANDRERDADRRAWHLAEAAVGPDEAVAAELERSADSARGRGGYAAAAAFLARAADLTPGEERRAVRRLHAAEAELAGGTPAVAAELLGQAMPSLVDPLQLAEARRLEARVRFAQGECSRIPAILLDAARALKPLDVTHARKTLIEAFEVSLYAGRDAGEASTRVIARVARETPRSRQLPESASDLLLDGFALLDVDYATAARLLQRAVHALVADHEAAGDEIPKFSELGCVAAGELQDDVAARVLAGQALRRARDRGDLMAMLPALGWQVRSEAFSGRFAAAEAALAEGREISSATGNIGVFGETAIIGLQVVVLRGDEARAREAATAAMREVTGRGMGGQISQIRWLLTILDLALGNYRSALDSARAVYEEDPTLTGTIVLPDYIEAAIRSGEPAAAEAAFERLSTRVLASGTGLALGLLARSGALLADDAEAEHLYAEAIDHLQRCPSAPQLARAHLLYGEWLRRRRRRRHARAQLRAAHEMFDAMGAEAFAERARVELLATGEHVRRRTIETRDELTPQEERIARLAAAGASNQEIAAQLFISSSTVAYHLRKVFRKLDVSHRTQLVHAIEDA